MVKKILLIFFLFNLSGCLSVVVLKKDYAELYYNLGNLYREQNKNSDAVICYKKALDIDPQFIENSYNLTKILIDDKKYDDAIDLLKKSVSNKPFNVINFELLGYAYYLKGDYKKSLAIYEYILSKNDLNENALYNTSLIYIKTGENEKALEKLLKYKDIITENSHAVKQLGLISLDAKKYDDATKFFAEYLEKNKSDSFIKLQYARTLSKIKDFSKAIEIYKELDASEPTDNLITFELAKIILLDLEDLKEGKEILLKALEKGFIDVDALYALPEKKDFLYKDELIKYLKELNFYYPPNFKRIKKDEPVNLIYIEKDKKIHLDSKCKLLKNFKATERKEKKVSINELTKDGYTVCDECLKNILMLPKEPYKKVQTEKEESATPKDSGDTKKS